MKHQDVISREYKLVLKAEKFVGSESSLITQARSFWDMLCQSSFSKCYGEFDPIDMVREIRFYDTDDLTLYHHDYIFRERTEAENGRREITLKFRHPDRYVAEDRDMLPKKIGKGERKFEEDIKSKFQILYSYSSTQPCKEDEKFELLKDISKFYPGIEKNISHFDEGEKLHPVNSMQIQEKVIKGGGFYLREEKAECALIVWYDLRNSDTEPAIVEFSFHYSNKKGKYHHEVSQCAYDLFLNLQDKMSGWIDKDANTKTGFMYKK